MCDKCKWGWMGGFFYFISRIRVCVWGRVEVGFKFVLIGGVKGIVVVVVGSYGIIDLLSLSYKSRL